MAENKNQNEQQEQQESRGRQGSANRGFASMDPERQRKIASEGGRAAHQQGVAHEWSSDEARAAGKKGGQNSHGGGRTSRSSSENQSDR